MGAFIGHYYERERMHRSRRPSFDFLLTSSMTVEGNIHGVWMVSRGGVDHSACVCVRLEKSCSECGAAFHGEGMLCLTGGVQC
jgi:hypothetical protein